MMTSSHPGSEGISGGGSPGKPSCSQPQVPIVALHPDEGFILCYKQTWSCRVNYTTLDRLNTCKATYREKHGLW